VKAFDLYANSSIYEGMSNTLLEAMACGAAVVATEVGGTPFIVRDGHNGLLVQPAAPKALANAVCSLISNPSFRENIVQNGLNYVREKHDLNVFVSTHERLYEEVYYQTTKCRTLSDRSSEAIQVVH
jgi:glycosyltransferase involved in cell wall biosynthesis